MLFGLLLLTIGIIYLLRNLGIITYQFWEIFWPSLLIVLGLALIYKRQRRKTWFDCFFHGDVGKKLKTKIEKKLEEE